MELRHCYRPGPLDWCWERVKPSKQKWDKVSLHHSCRARLEASNQGTQILKLARQYAELSQATRRRALQRLQAGLERDKDTRESGNQSAQTRTCRVSVKLSTLVVDLITLLRWRNTISVSMMGKIWTSARIGVQKPQTGTKHKEITSSTSTKRRKRFCLHLTSTKMLRMDTCLK